MAAELTWTNVPTTNHIGGRTICGRIVGRTKPVPKYTQNVHGCRTSLSIMKEKAICLREIPQITKNTALDMAVLVKITSSSFDWSVRKASQFEGSCICQDNVIYLK